MVIRALIVFVTFIGAAGVIARAERTDPIPPRQSLSAFPMTVDGLQGRNDKPLTEEELAILGADEYLMRTYLLA